MKVAVALARHWFGGAQSLALGLSEHLSDSVLLAPMSCQLIDEGMRRGLEAEVIQAPYELLQYGGRTARLPASEQLWLYLSRVLPYARRVARRLETLGVDVLYAGEERAQVLLGMGAALAGIPTLWHLQGGIVQRSRPVQAMAALLSSEIVCVSNAVADDLRRNVRSELLPGVSVVYNGVADRSLARNEGDGMQLAAVSRISPTKGIHHAIDALSRVVRGSHPEARLLVAGSLKDDPDYARYLQAMVDRLGVRGQTTFCGHVDDVHEVYSRASIALCPSVERERLSLGGQLRDVASKEGFCLAAAEAMRAGCPVIASRSYGLKEVVADGETGVCVPPSDPAALASAIAALLSDPGRRRALGRAARARYESHFQKARMLRELDLALARVAHGRPRTHLAALRSVAEARRAVRRVLK